MTTGWLLDTNVLSELRRASPDSAVPRLIAAQPLEALHTSAAVVAEIRFGIEVEPDASRRALLTDWLEHTVRPMFGLRILDIDENIMLRWRLLVAEARKVGYTYSQPDLLIAASALEYDLTLITRNVKDFQKTGVALLNPWARLGTRGP